MVLLSYGPQGFVIGPMAVVLAYGLIRFLSGQSVLNEVLVCVVNDYSLPHIFTFINKFQVDRISLIIIMSNHILHHDSYGKIITILNYWSLWSRRQEYLDESHGPMKFLPMSLLL